MNGRDGRNPNTPQRVPVLPVERSAVSRRHHRLVPVRSDNCQIQIQAMRIRIRQHIAIWEARTGLVNEVKKGSDDVCGDSSVGEKFGQIFDRREEWRKNFSLLSLFAPKMFLLRGDL
jgi:hypothetical protein